MTVLDASVVVNVLIGRTDPAVLDVGDDVVAPDQFLVEVASGLRRAAHLRWIPRGAAPGLFVVALEIPIELVPSRELVVRAFELRDQMSVYDASYVALAEQRECGLITSDARLARAPGLAIPITVV